MPEDDIAVRVKMRGTTEFKRDAHGAADAVEDIGDEARKAAVKIRSLSASTSSARVNFGPFSTSLRGGALALGGLINLTEKAAPSILGAAEAVVTLTGGGAAAGGVGLLGLAQGSAVAKLGLGGLTDALGGSEEAARGLSPQVRGLFDEITAGRAMLRGSAEAGMLPGITTGIDSAMKNLPILNDLVGDTARMLGGLGEDAGGMLGSKAWGRDLKTLGGANVQILDDLGHSALFFADSARNVLTEAAPLATWLSGMALDGSAFVKTWTDSARASGDMARFFRDARTDMALLGSITGNTGRGLINLFGASDVDGTKTLQSLDQVMARFERWSASPAMAGGFGDAIIAEIPQFVGGAATALAEAMPGAALTAATVFGESFMEAEVWGKLALGGWFAKKLGAGKLAKQMVKQIAGGTALGGITKKAPLPVFVVNPGFGGAPAKGGKGGKGVPPAMMLGRTLLSATTVTIAGGAIYKLFENADNIDRWVDRKAPPWLNPHGDDNAGSSQRGVRGRGLGRSGLSDKARMGDIRPGAPAELRRLQEAARARNPLINPAAAPQLVDHVDVHFVPIHMDGEKVADLQAKVRLRRQASN